MKYDYNNTKAKFCPRGYFVEFSDYENGRVNGYVAAVTGNSTVPITVSAGQVFNTVENGETIYVDTVILPFDRNITDVTVDGSVVTLPCILKGNRVDSYTVTATDAEENSVTIIIPSNSIKSISEPIENLTVKNVRKADIPAIIAVKTSLKAIDVTNATDLQKKEITAAIKNCDDLYFAVLSAIATSATGSNGWYNAADVAIEKTLTLTAPTDFLISTSAAGPWSSSIELDKTEGANKSKTYYLKNIISTDYYYNEVSPEKTFNYKVDETAPTGTITIKENRFTSFLNTITFGYFFNNTVDVTITGTDNLNGSVNISYQKVTSDSIYNPNGTWTSGGTFSIDPAVKCSVYAKIADDAGNTTIINTDGIVVYTNSILPSVSAEYEKFDPDDVEIAVTTNNNTFNTVKLNDATLTKDDQYIVNGSSVSIKSDYLSTLKPGTYTITISMNPLGEAFVNGITIGDAPSDLTFSLAVKPKSLADENGDLKEGVTVEVSPSTKVYDGKAFAPTVTVKDGGKILSDSTDYSVNWTADMINVDEKTVTITFRGNYSGSVTKTVNVTKASLTDTTDSTQSAIYDGTEKSITAPTATAVNKQTVTVKYSTDNSATYESTSLPFFTAAGTYNVGYQLSAPNHNDVTGVLTFEIKAAENNRIINLTLTGWTFGESGNTPTATAVYGTPVFTYSDSENGTYTDTVPTNAGTYYVKASVAQTTDYNAAEAKLRFIISVKTVAANDIVLGNVAPSYIYTGNAITPEPTVTLNDNLLTKTTDYTVSYQNNTAIGTDAEVIVTLCDNYSGNAQKTFKIVYGTATLEQKKDMITLPSFNSYDWCNADIDIDAKTSGFEISTSPNGPFGSRVTAVDESTYDGSDFTIYIRDKKTGGIYEQTIKYKLDKTAPTGSVSIEKNGLRSLLRAGSFNLFFNDDAMITVSASDSLSTVDTIEIYKSDKELSQEEFALVSWTTYTGPFTETKNDAETFIYYARITDKAGNVFISSSDGVTFDLTAPVISGVTNGKTYYTSQAVISTDANQDTLTVNGELIQSGDTILGNIEQTYEIVSTDKAGNISAATVYMKPISSIADLLKDIDPAHPDPGKKDDIENLKKLLEDMDTENATDEEKQLIKSALEKSSLILQTIERIEQNAVNTGDNSNMILWAVLLLVSGGLLTTIGMTKKRKKANSK